MNAFDGDKYELKIYEAHHPVEPSLFRGFIFMFQSFQYLYLYV